jgi:hypothetical protein
MKSWLLSWWCWVFHRSNIYRIDREPGYRVHPQWKCKRCGRGHVSYNAWKDPEPDPGTPPNE